MHSSLRPLLPLLLSLFAAPAAASYLSVHSPAGEPIGNGTSLAWYSPDAGFNVVGTHEMVNVQVYKDGEFFNLEFYAPRGKTLEPGSYFNAESAGRHTGKAPGLNVVSTHGTCSDTWGSFTIRQIEWDGEDHISRLEATYAQRCDSPTAPLLSGTINFNAPPLSFAYTSGSGEPLANGKAQTLFQSTSDLALAGSANAITYGASGLRDNWYMAISPRFSTTLAPGNYQVARVHSATKLGLYVTNNGIACDTVSGTIHIKALTFDEWGQATGLNAVLTLYCNGSVVPFKGTIRHKL
jgi:hypothetical protein